IDVGRFLPPKFAAAAGKYLGGKLTAIGDVDYGFALEDFDLTLGPTPAPADKTIRVHKGRIFTNDDFDTIQIQKVAVEAGGANHATFEGKIDTVNPENTEIKIDHEFPNLGMWLQRLGFPQFAMGAGGGQIVIKGSLKSPTIVMNESFQGVPCMENLTV